MTAIYVSATAGDDTTGDGTQLKPKRTIQAGSDLAASGDTVLVEGGIYNEAPSVGVTNKTNVTFQALDPASKPIIEGDGLNADIGLKVNYQPMTNLVIDGFEVRNFLLFGIQAAVSAGTPVASTHWTVRNCHVHHIGSIDPAKQAQQAGINMNYGVGNSILDCEVHHIFGGSEAIGIWCQWGQDWTVKRNLIYMCRKEGIRLIYPLHPDVQDNQIFGCWAAHTLEFWIGGNFINNIVWDSGLGIYAKQCNDDQIAIGGTGGLGCRSYWGTLVNGGTTMPAEWCRVWHNTVYRCSLAHYAVAAGGTSGSICDYVDFRNNLVVFGPSMGASVIQDGPARRGENIIVDGNGYSTTGAQPRYFYLNGYLYGNTGITPANQDTLAGMQAQNGWELNARVIDPQLTDPDAGDFTLQAGSPVADGSFDLTADGSSRGTQLGARLAQSAKALALNPGGTVIDQSASGGSFSQIPQAGNVLDENDQTYWSTAFAPHSGSGGAGLNEFFTADAGAAVTFDHLVAPNFSTSTFCPKTVSFEVADDPAGPWRNLCQDPGIVGFPAVDAIRLRDASQVGWHHQLAAPVTGRYLKSTFVDSFGADYVVTAGVEPALLVAGGTGGGGSGNDPGGTVAPMKLVNKDVRVLREAAINVQYPEYGATGGGASDEKTALQAALDAVRTSGGGHLFVPDGLYLVSDELRIGSNTRLELAAGATIKRNAASSYMLRSYGAADTDTPAGTGYTGPSNIEVFGGTWDGNKAAFPQTHNIISPSHGQYFTIRDCTLENCYGWHFIEFHAMQHATARNVVCRDYDAVTTSKEMIQLDVGSDGTACEDILIDGCRFVNGDRGVGSHSVATHKNIRVIGCHFDTMRESGIRVYAWQHVVVQGNTIENTQTGIHLLGASPAWRNFAILGNVITIGNAGGGQIGILADGASTASRYIREAVIAQNLVRMFGSGIAGTIGIKATCCQELVVAQNVVSATAADGILLDRCIQAQVVGNQSRGNALTGTAGTSDLTVKGSTATDSQDVLVANNGVAKMYIGPFGGRIAAVGNIVDTSLTVDATNAPTGFQKANNFIAGTWTP